MRLPDFLIIGAMKSGTTTLYHDLLSHPKVFLPVDKEVHALIDDTVRTEAGTADYARHFEPARPEQRLAEASTGYTKRPTYQDVPTRARDLLGPDLKLIYIVREPISRALSHHYHAFSWNEIHGDADRALREDPTFVDYSRYAYQLEPWLETFSPEQLRVVKFEDYTHDRQAGAAELFEFLGLDPAEAQPDTGAVHNQGDNRPIHKGLLSVVNRSAIYRKGLRSVIPPSFRQFLYRTVFPKAPDRPAPPTRATLELVRDRLQDDQNQLRSMLGDAAPSWDLNAAIDKILGEPAPSTSSPASTPAQAPAPTGARS